MNLSNCTRCHRVFSKNVAGEEVCPTCLKQSESSYKKIFEYFTTKPAATAKEIAEATGVDVKDIHRFVRERRLQLAKVQFMATCEKCGGPIFGGRVGGKICDHCREGIASELRNNFQKRHNSLKTSQDSSNSNPKGSQGPKKQ